MSILVFGRTGQLASELIKIAPNATFVGREVADLTRSDAIEAEINTSGVTAVINAAAYTAVDKAQSEPELAHQINAIAPSIMAKCCKKLGYPFIHYSTDYVFDGTGLASRDPSDECAPLNVYGASKRAGEEAILSTNPNAAIFRTSWVFSSHGSNFVKTMLKLGQERETLSIIDDQIGGPTSARSLANLGLIAVEKLLESPRTAEVFHFAGQPFVSWASFAEEIFLQSDLNVSISRIATEDYPTPATRPKNSRLDCSTTCSTFGVEQPDWKKELSLVLQEISG